MPEPWVPRLYSNLAGGLNTQSSNLKLAEGQFRVARNFHLDNDGAISIRNGFTHIDTEADTVLPIATGLFQYRPASGADELLKINKNSGAFSNAKLQRRSGGTWVDISEVGFTIADHDYATAVQWGNNVYWFLYGGTNRMLIYNGTDVREVADSGVFWGGVLFYDRLWAFGNGSTLSYSATGNAAVWTTGNAGTIDVALGDGDLLTGIAELFDRLLAFKRDRLFLVSGTTTTTFNLQPVVSDGGALAFRSIAKIENRVFYLSEKGVYSTDGTAVEPISVNITPDRMALNRARDRFAVAIHNRRRSQYILVCSDTTSTTHNVALVCNYRFDTVDPKNGQRQPPWTRFSNFPFNAGHVVQGTNDDDQLFFGGYTGFVYVYDFNEAGVAITTDDGVTITVDGRTRWMDHDRPDQSKLWRLLVPVFSATGVSTGFPGQLRLGVQHSMYIQLRLTGSRTSVTLEVYNDGLAGLDETTVQQSLTVPIPGGVSFAGLMQYTIDAQMFGLKVPTLN